MIAPRTPGSIRWPTALHLRIQAFATTHRMSLSAVIRLAVNRGLLAMEREARGEQDPNPPAANGQQVQQPRRRVFSPGVG